MNTLVLRTISYLLLANLAYSQSAIQIVVLEGAGGINNIATRTAWPPVIQVVDETGAAVKGATVTFVLPASGPGATFAGGLKTLTLQSDTEGKAVVRGLAPNGIPGRFDIVVTASSEGRTVKTVISQTNAGAVARTGSGRRTALWLALIAGGVGGALAAAGGGGNGGGSPTSPPPSGGSSPGAIVPGTPGFGPPR